MLALTMAMLGLGAAAAADRPAPSDAASRPVRQLRSSSCTVSLTPG